MELTHAKLKSELHRPQYGQSAINVEVVEFTQTEESSVHTKFPGHESISDCMLPYKLKDDYF